MPRARRRVSGGSPGGWGRGPTLAAVADIMEAAVGGWAGGLAIIAIGMSDHTVCTALVAHHTLHTRNEIYLPGIIQHNIPTYLVQLV